MSTGEMIPINRDGQQYGPYTIDQVNEYLAAGNLLLTDQAWNAQTSAWVSLGSVPGIRATPPPGVDNRNIGLLILMFFVWWIVMFFVTCFLIGLIGGIFFASQNAADAGAAGHTLGQYIGLPVLFVSLGLSIWLTIIGKLPGTRKK